MLGICTKGMEYFFKEVNKIVYFSLGALEKGKEKFPETTCLLFNKVLLLLYMSVWEREIYICSSPSQFYWF